MRLAATHLTGRPAPSADLKRVFIEALNLAQSTTIQSLDDDLYLDFENPDLVRLLVDRTVFSPEEVAGGAHLLSIEHQSQFAATIEAAKLLLARANPNLYCLIKQIIGSVAAYRIPHRDGGSVSCCIGLIWLSPHADWTIEYCAEMLVHEFVHNSVFLEDMVRGIMPNPALLEHEEALSVSAIRQTRRPYDKAFHSACVTAAIMYYYHIIGESTEASKHLAPLKRTIDELYEHDRVLKSRNLDLLTENGREMVEELRRFVQGPDYSMIVNALAS